MSEENIKDVKLDIDNEVVDDEEYKRAMELLNSSKSKRLKKKSDNKKSEKKAEKQNKTLDANKEKVSFIKKCKKDPVIPICFVLAFLAIVGAALYFIIPMFSVTSFDFTVDQFKTKYESSEMYTKLLAEFDLAIPTVEYIESSSFTSSDEEVNSASGNVLYFTGKTASTYNTYFQGCVKKTDGKIVYINILIPYTQENVESGFAIFYMASFLQAVNDITAEQAVTYASEAMTTFAVSSNFKDAEKSKYKMNLVKNGETTFISFEIVPID